MKLGGFLFLLHRRTVPAFILAGVAVEILGLVLVLRAHLPAPKGKG